MENPEEELPEDLIGAILLKVPIKPLMRFKTVSKNWRSLINSQPFAFRPPRRTTSLFVHCQQKFEVRLRHQQHGSYIVPLSVRRPRVFKKRPKIDLPHTNDHKFSLRNLFPAGHGIICCFELITGTVSLWNPTTDQTQVLPPSPYPYSLGIFDYQFAAVDEDNKAGTFSYKVGRFCSEKVYLDGEDYQCSLSLELYSSKTKSWKFIPKFYTGALSRYADSYFHCANLNGKSHWVTQSPHTDHTFITAFDYETEVFTRIKAPSPPQAGTHYDKSRCLVTLFDDKFLCIGLYEQKYDATSYLDIWVLREYGVEDSWIKEFTVGPLHEHMEVVGFSSKLQCVFLRNTEYDSGYLLFCDCKSSKITKYVPIGNQYDLHMQVIEHVRSPVSVLN